MSPVHTQCADMAITYNMHLGDTKQKQETDYPGVRIIMVFLDPLGQGFL